MGEEIDSQSPLHFCGISFGQVWIEGLGVMRREYWVAQHLTTLFWRHFEQREKKEEDWGRVVCEES